MPKPNNREREIFEAALELNSAEARHGYLLGACGGDAGLRARIEALLRANEEAGAFLPLDEAKPAGAAAVKTILMPAAMFPQTEKAGDRIGRYKLREKIGEGGCGAVYVAEQEEPVRRRVAIKVIKLGMDTKSVMARFEAERQALAMMDHPNIAKVLDAGATEAGRPYFVMELVRGIKITDYCDQHKLSIRDRLDLFVKVCQAIQHAHQKGIIHRDIKPSNILVTMHDGVPVPKIIDFGISKATEGRLTDLTVYTELNQFIGTPAYMSPEQAEMSGLDIDTRSDVYSLGVLLYELLTGRTPFDAKELMESGLDAMRKTIREAEPQRPSTRLSTMMAADLTTIAQRHGAEPPRLVNLIRGDLDWVVMKALEKDRTRRYDTANGLALDIKRHLDNEPIVARPPSSAYRFQKMVRRNKLAVAAATAVLAALIVGMCLAAWALVRERAARARAEFAQKAAGTEAAKQVAINNFLNQMFASADPEELAARDETKGRAVTVVQVLDAAAKQLETGALKDRPEIEEAVRQTLGKTYENLGQFNAADAQLRRALELDKQVDGPESPATARTLNALGRLRMSQDNLPEAEKLQREELELQKKLNGGKESPEVAAALYDLAMTQMEEALGSPVGVPEAEAAEAEATFREALSMQRRLLPSKDRNLASTLTGLARLLMYRNKTDESATLFNEALAIQKDALGAEHPDVAVTMQQLSEVIYKQNKFSEAEDLCRQAIAIQRQALGNDHPALGTSLQSIGNTLAGQNKYAEAEAAYREALSIRRKALGEYNVHVAWSQKALAETLTAEQKLPEAEEVYREEVVVWAKCRGVGNDGYQDAVQELFGVLNSEKKFSEAESFLRQVLSLERASLGEDTPIIATTLSDLADVLASQNRNVEAAQTMREYMDSIFKSNNPNPATLLPSVDNLAAQSMAGGGARDAEKVYEDAIRIESERLGPSHPIVGALYHEYGRYLWSSEERFDAAGEQLLKALAIRRSVKDQGLVETLHTLGFVLIRCGKLAEAEQYSRESIELYRSFHKPDNYWDVARPTGNLADALAFQHKWPEAERAYRDAIALLSKPNGGGLPEDNPPLVLGLIHTLRAENKPSEAQTLQDSLAKEPPAAIAVVMLGAVHTLKALNRLDEAAEVSQEVSAIMQKLPEDGLDNIPEWMIKRLLNAGYKRQVANVCQRTLASTSTDSAWFNNLSWPFATSEMASNRDPDLAVALAKRAVELTPQNGWVWNTLGVACYRTGDFHEAIANIEKAVRLDHGCTSADAFFLAMAHHQLGDDEAARRYQAQGIQWMDEHDPQNPELTRFRSETDALLTQVSAK